MKVKELMTTTPFYCQLETNLASATELMWNANCGFLPIVADDGKVVGVVTDRDICIALGTRNRLPGEVTIGEVITCQKLIYCCPDDDLQIALQAMQSGAVRRLPVITREGTLAGVISMDDILLHAESSRWGRKPEVPGDAVIEAYRAISQQQLSAKRAFA